MNEANVFNTQIFPGTPFCATTGNDIAPKFLAMMVVAKCRTSCEELAETLGSDPCEEHDAINDCLAACDEYTGAAARESHHTMRYAIWCAERCEDLRSACLRMETPAAKTAAKWLKTVSKQMDREVISWQRIRKAMDQEVTWDSVKDVMNHQVIAFDPFGSAARAKASGEN
ncbi:MAG: hypothetical protein ABJQ29_16945 [Luteolibacter sp.]